MFEWQTGEESWEQSHTSDTRSSEPREPRASQATRRRIIALLGVLILAAAIAAGALRWESGQGMAQARADLQAAVDQEAWARQTGNQALFESLLDPRAPANWRRHVTRDFPPSGDQESAIEITDITLERPDVALVELTQHRSGTVLRDTRAYRRAESNWLRTSPPAGQFWVHQQETETENLRFVFHPSDTEQVGALAPQLQNLYDQLLEDFNLLPPENKRTLIIALSVRPANAGLDDPRLADLSYLQKRDLETLKCHLGTGLAGRVLKLFDNEAGDWTFLIHAMSNWEVGAWAPACKPDTRSRIAELLDKRPFVPLSFLTPKQLDGAPTPLAESFVDYLVSRYGRDALADLALEMTQHRTWPELVAALSFDYVTLTDNWWQSVVSALGPDVGRPAPEPDEVRDAIQWMLNLESQAIQNGDRQLLELLLDPKADSVWRQQVLREFDKLQAEDSRRWAELESLTLAGKRAQVVVQIKAPAVAGVRPIFSRPETRTYRYTAGRWVRTSPPRQSESELRETETIYVQLQFRESEADFATQLTAGMDKFYATVAEDFGIELNPNRDDSKVPVEIVHAHVRPFRGRDDPIVVLWPGAAAEYVQTDSPLNYSRTTLAYGLSRHLLFTATEPATSLAANLVREALVRWEVNQRVGHISWLPDPDAAIAEILQSDTELRISDPAQSNAADTLSIYISVVDYIAQRYGTPAFSNIVRYSSRYDSIARILTEALGIDFEAFEAGWQAHVYNTRS